MRNNLLKEVKTTDRYILYIYFYLFIMPWNFFNAQMGVLTGILLIWWIIKYKTLILKKTIDSLRIKSISIFILFILFNYLGCLWSDNYYEAFSTLNKFFKYVIIFIPILITSLNYEEAKKSIMVILSSFFLYSLFSLSIYLNIINIEGTNTNNPKGIIEYALMSMYMSFLFFWSIINFFYEKDKKKKAFFLIIAFLGLFILSINYSRTAQISFLLTLLVLVIFYFRMIILNKKMLFFLMSILLLGISLIYFNKGKLNRYIKAYNETVSGFEHNEFSGSFGARLYFNKIGFEIISNNIFFGVGQIDNREILTNSQLDKNSQLKSREVYGSFHSMHLEVLTSIGLIGYLIFIFSQIFLLLQLRNNKKYFLITFSFLLIINFNSLANVLFYQKPLIYTFVSIFIILSLIGGKKEIT